MQSLFQASLFQASLAKSGLTKIVFGAAAISLTLGAVQLASGHDLPVPSSSENPVDTVNRAAKADRAVIAAPVAPTRTIGFRPGDLPDTSVLVRIPWTKEARETTRAPVLIKSGQSAKPMVACEPVVSVLTEVARKLQPGRCVT
jgi:hypothetical protein